MNPAQLERLSEHLVKLRLFKSRERLEALLQHAAEKELAYSDFLEQVLGEEVAAKTSKNVTMRTSMARFPFVKPLETFDFSYQPSIDKKQVQGLASCHFIEHGDNVLVLGPPRVGKPRRRPGLAAGGRLRLDQRTRHGAAERARPRREESSSLQPVRPASLPH